MAIRPNNEYPGATTSPDSNYPYGGARNVSSPGDDTGTPWEEKLINDIFGFQQALLQEANITPNDNPETAAVSQYLGAIQSLIQDSVDYEETTVEPGGDFDAGQTIKLVRSRGIVVASADSLSHTDSPSPSAADTIPAGFRPAYSVANVYRMTPTGAGNRVFREVNVQSNGFFQLWYLNSNFDNFSTTASTPFTITYLAS